MKYPLFPPPHHIWKDDDMDCGAWMKPDEESFTKQQMKEYAKAAVELNKRCTSCDDTGDITSFDGRWLGYCVCSAGKELKGKS